MDSFESHFAQWFIIYCHICLFRGSLVTKVWPVGTFGLAPLFW